MPDLLKPSPALRAISRKRRNLVLSTAGVGLLAVFRHDAFVSVARANGIDLAAVEARRADQKAQLCSATNLSGVGLRGEYFADEDWRGSPLLTRVDGPVDLDNSFDWPAERQDKRPLSVRWSGWVKPPLTGKYRFHADVAGARVVVAKQELAGRAAAADAHIELAAGRYYPILLEVRHLSPGSGRVRLEWTAPHGSRFVVPRALLFLPTEAAAPEKI